MCGITGFVNFSESNSSEVLHDIVKRMTTPLQDRGPDDRGSWADNEAGVALGHSRLSVIDLSPQGHQPMHSACGRYVITFNGEIYNFRDMRRELELCGTTTWRGHSDTEVMLAAFAAWGIETAVRKFVGMFAFALWDRQHNVLYLVRDRMGEKPLYYGWQGKTFLFGSELKALRAHPAWQPEINRQALATFLRLSYVPAPDSIFDHIYTLTPGTMVAINCAKGVSGWGIVPQPSSYWSVLNAAERGAQSTFTGTDCDGVQRLDELLRSAIEQQMVADVPLGAFLSGGVDSSTIVALMQTQSDRPVQTFTIGYRESQYNEAAYAKEVAFHLGTKHTELYITPRDALDIIPRLPMLYDEPFADVSQIPVHVLSRLTRQHVTVSLSGDGGDELFGGYNRYLWVENIWRRIGRLPKNIRGLIAVLLTSLPPRTWDQLFRSFEPVLPEKFIQRTPGDKLHKLATVMNVDTPLDMYERLISQWQNPSSLVREITEPATELDEVVHRPSQRGLVEIMMYLDMTTYLPNDILVKMDRASMGAGLESRSPFLDHRVVEFAWQIPLSMKIRNGQGKWLLRKVLDQYVPKTLIDRPKAGFAVPLDVWLRGPLREWAETLLDERRIYTEGFLNPAPIRQKWVEHLSGRYNWQYQLWNVLMFQSWLETYNGR